MSVMARLLNYFLKGLVLLAPFAITVYVCVRVFATIDGWLGLPIPGAGFVATVVLITLFGFLASSFLTRRMLGALESMLERLPFVRLLYSSTRARAERRCRTRPLLRNRRSRFACPRSRSARIATSRRSVPVRRSGSDARRGRSGVAVEASSRLPRR